MNRIRGRIERIAGRLAQPMDDAPTEILLVGVCRDTAGNLVEDPERRAVLSVGDVARGGELGAARRQSAHARARF